jgi:hypothetical protein
MDVFSNIQCAHLSLFGGQYESLYTKQMMSSWIGSQEEGKLLFFVIFSFIMSFKM